MALACLLGVPTSRLEPSQVLHYGQGAAYRWHYDAYDGATARGKANMERRGQRLRTAIIYLNDVPAGGETAFLYLRQAIAPRRGRLLTFANVVTPPEPGASPSVDRRSFHAGMPVLQGTKWIITTFVRER